MFNRLSKQLQSIMPGRMVGNSLSSKQQSLLRILSISHSQRLEPKTLIQNLAAEYPDAYGRKLLRLQRWVAADSSMSAAIAHTPGVLSDGDALAIQCGIETNTLDETFDYLLEHNRRNEETTAAGVLRSSLEYVVAVLCFSIVIATFLMLFVVPTFVQLFDEFDMAIPFAMSSLIEFCKDFSLALPLVLLIALGVAVLFLSEDFRRLARHSPLGKLAPTVATRQSAGLLRLLAMPSKTGKPLAPTLTAAAQFHPDPKYRQRLLQARTDSVSDTDIWSQLARQKLISKNQGEQLGYITDSSLRAWTLSTLSDRTGDRAARRSEFLARIMQHIPVLMVGLFVGWIAIAIMQTLTHLIRSLA
jgi:type II secretory pathway component PulF